MADATADWKAALLQMSDAFGAGDNRRGEELLAHALDGGAPWDVATSTVAQALSVRLQAGRQSPEATSAA
jgi:hypothetical protein